MAAQDQTPATKACRVTILEQKGSKNFHMCSERNKTVIHILSKYSYLAQTKYKTCHGKVPAMVHWVTLLHSKYGFQPAKHWYEHKNRGGDRELGRKDLV